MRSTTTRVTKPVRFTREVLAIIPVWLELGAKVEEIVAALGTTENSLRATCCNYDISLRSSGGMLRGALTQEHWIIIQHEAMRRGVPVWQFVADVIGAVVDRGLFAEVLNERGKSCEAR